MQGESLSLSKSSLAYAKLSATPTETAWSQVYNAGNLFACLALTLDQATDDSPLLQNVGKEIFNNLETEFFTLEEKTPASITQAIEKSIKQVPDGVAITFCLAFFKDHALYLFLVGSGRVVMKREEKIGVLLERQDSSRTVLTSSGYLRNGDTIVLQTDHFTKNISDTVLTDALQLPLPSDIAETLSLPMHAKGDGAQAALIIVYHGISQPALAKTPAVPLSETDEALAKETEEETPIASHLSLPDDTDKQDPPPKRPPLPSFSDIGAKLSHIHLPTLGNNNRRVVPRLSHRKKFFLSITVVIALLLVVSIVLTKQKQESSKNNELFQSIYQPAFRNYDDGKSLKGLNDELSRDDFLKAQKALKDAQDKFPQGSTEDKQIEELLTKVEAELGGATEAAPSSTTDVKEATVDNTNMLAIENAAKDGRGFSQDASTIYYITDKAVVAVTKTDGKKSNLLTNDNAWTKPVGLAPYQGNVYVLDQKAGVIKYTKAADEFGKSNYFKSAQDMSKAVALAIDSSIWILSSDGSIKKYTRGEPDAFTIKGLKTPLKSPTKIYTDPDITNVYVLDNGNSRIVKLSVDGAFQAEYVAPSIKQAKDFEVLEKDKILRFLSNGKIYELGL
jgi:hypothetical protein